MNDQQINWEDEADLAINDASRVASKAMRDQMASESFYRDEVILQSLETQKQIADAVLKKAIALQQKCEAMSLLYKGDTDGFLDKYSVAMKSTRESVRSAAAWAAGVQSSPELYDSHVTAAIKIANTDRQFSDRNKSGLTGLFTKILLIEKNINKFIEKSMNSAHKIVSDVKFKALDFRGALRSFVKNTFSSVADAAAFATTVTGVSMAAGAGVANKAINATSEAVSLAVSAVAGVVDAAVEKATNHVAQSFKAGDAAILNRQARRFINSMDDAIHLGDTFNLENQLKTHPECKQMAIVGRNGNPGDHKNMMDWAIQAADSFVKRMEAGDIGGDSDTYAVDMKALERISKTIDVLDKHEVVMDFLPNTTANDEAMIREKMAAILKDHHKPQMRMRA
jgi:hypothetical protein